MKSKFSSSDTFMAWNEEMIEKYHPSGYHQSSNPIIRWIEGRRTAKIFSVLNVQEEEDVLDIGCGAGDMLQKLHKGNMYGIDISKRLVAEASARLGDAAFITCGDAESAKQQFGEHTFDKVFCSEVLEHVEHPSNVLKNIAGLTKPKGIAVVSVPNENLINRIKRILGFLKILRILFPNISEKMDDEWHLHTFSKSQLRELFAQAGLHIIRIYSIPFPFFPLRFVVRAQPMKKV